MRYCCRLKGQPPRGQMAALWIIAPTLTFSCRDQAQAYTFMWEGYQNTISGAPDSPFWAFPEDKREMKPSKEMPHKHLAGMEMASLWYTVSLA